MPAPGAPATSAPQRPGYRPTPAGTAPPSTPPPTTAPAAVPRIHRVAPGESLWSIARAHLARGTGRDQAQLGNREVAVYWVRLVAANRARLRSGNPDLIFPGEYVRLPLIRR
jgi:nucleoid-associated protein YgaU